MRFEPSSVPMKASAGDFLSITVFPGTQGPGAARSAAGLLERQSLGAEEHMLAQRQGPCALHMDWNATEPNLL